MLEIGTIFTGKWFTGKILVEEILPNYNELKVKLQNKDSDYWWFETWNLEHTLWGFQQGDYFNI